MITAGLQQEGAEGDGNRWCQEAAGHAQRSSKCDTNHSESVRISEGW